MPESALLVGSPSGNTSLIRACLDEFQLETTVTSAREALSPQVLEKHGLLVCELPLIAVSPRQVVAAAKPIRPAVPVILVGGSPGREASDAARAGADAHVTRPLTREKLARAVTRALLRRKTALESAALGCWTGSGSRVLSGVVESLTRCLEASERLNIGHAQGVAGIAAKLAEHYGLSRSDAEAARLAGALHDLGKVGVRRGILTKPGSLSSAEWREVRRHPETGAEILSSVEAFAQFAVYVRHHHERYDGTGYPLGLCNGQIPLVSKIVSVADAYHAMVSPRAYRPCSGPAYAAGELRANAGKQWDPDVVHSLFACLPGL